MFAAEKLNKFLHFLNALDCTTKQEETSSLRQLDTCTWLRTTKEYRSWRNGNESFLLLQGKGHNSIFCDGYATKLFWILAGAGKTVLAYVAACNYYAKTPLIVSAVLP